MSSLWGHHRHVSSPVKLVFLSKEVVGKAGGVGLPELLEQLWGGTLGGAVHHVEVCESSLVSLSMMVRLNDALRVKIW